MAYVPHGSLTHEIEGKQVVMTEGDLLIMNRNAHHTAALCGQEDIMINFIVLPEFFERAMQQALYLPKNTDFPIQDVCVQVGYSNNTFFYKLFKETYGVTPKKYREAFSRGRTEPDRHSPG